MKLLRFLILWSLTFSCFLQISHGLKTRPKPNKVKPANNKNKTKNTTIRPISSKKTKNVEVLTIKMFEITFDANLIEVISEIPIPTNGEIVVGRDTVGQAGGKLIFQCVSQYPVQWIYTGDGNPEITTNLTISEPTKRSDASNYVANVGLGFNTALRESFTGEYICKKVQVRKNWEKYSPKFASVYVYVPGSSLFIQKTGESLYPPKDANWVRIPCSVTHPDVIVTLQKKNENGLLQCPSEHEVRFSPKSGFIVTSLIREVWGKYVCIGSFNGTTTPQEMIQLVEYSVTEEEKKLTGKNKKQKKVGPKKSASSAERAFGHSRLNYFEEEQDDKDSFEEEIHPRNDKGESSSLSCFPSNPCGPNSVCKTTPGNAPIQKCSCRVGFMGRPPNCRPECILDMDCPAEMECSGQRCSNPCSLNRCGQGARCRVVNHRAKCSCPPGHIGNPERNGKCGRSRGPSLQYFPVEYEAMRESGEKFGGFVSGGSHEFGGTTSESEESNENSVAEVFVQNQDQFPCDPWPCGPNSQCKPVGADAHCYCSKGYIGTPPHCRPECSQDSHCPDHLTCIETKCRDPCVFTEGKCGVRASCRTVGHKPSCRCLNGFYGDPYVKCRPQRDDQNPANRPPQFPDSPRPIDSNNNGPFQPISRPPRPPPQQNYPVMMTMMKPGTNYPGSNYPQPSPCTNSPCGKNALCSYRNETVGCKCPPHLSGFGSDPYLECYPRSNPCEMCGPHSQCVVDERGGSPTICTCLEGKVGSPPNCRDGFCQKNRECGDNQHCFGGRCDDPCKRANCGRSAVCRSMRHLAVCACRNAPDRDPLTGCPPKVRDYYDDGDNSREYYVYRGT
ncbi:uncharacterized protein LOC110854096 [Folsomia candida]|uniref:Pro-epidermal growth factor n=1 Tax=Folsomia candida TaxID=158441 RepID=A0A226DXW5_FOLCA|nr:uncharacterized protein LOC110854096 [Folsomia candida]OXA50315.1 Pro-epidermal growth factor [Folsomia candida]